MGNEVGTPVQGLGALMAGARKTKAALPSFGGKGYLKFGKDGEWTLGQNGDAVNDEEVLFNINSYETGFVCWTNYPDGDKRKNEKMGEVMQPVAQGPVDVSNLPDYGWTWKPQLAINGRFVGGDKAEFQHVTSSMGGLEWLDSIFNLVLERIEDGERVYVFPIVELQADSYQHSKYGKIYKPSFEVTGWADVEGNIEGEPVAELDAPKKDKKKKKDKKAKAVAQPEVSDEPSEDDGEDDDAPLVRRRRR